MSHHHHHHHEDHYGGHYGGHHGYFDYHHHDHHDHHHDPHHGYYPSYSVPMYPVATPGPMVRSVPHVDVYNRPSMPVYPGVQYSTGAQYSAGMPYAAGMPYSAGTPISSMQSAPYPTGTVQFQGTTATGYGSPYPPTSFAPSNILRPTLTTAQQYMPTSQRMNYEPSNQQTRYNPSAPPMMNDQAQAYQPPSLYAEAPPTYNEVMTTDKRVI